MPHIPPRTHARYMPYTMYTTYTAGMVGRHLPTPHAHASCPAHSYAQTHADARFHVRRADIHAQADVVVHLRKIIHEVQMEADKVIEEAAKKEDAKEVRVHARARVSL